MKILPTVRQLQFFLALCETGNYRRAADGLGITQPALSAAIKELESLLGGAMIDRSDRRKVTPTRAGAVLLAQARDVMGRYESMCDDARRAIDPQSWTIRLGVIPTIAPYIMPHVLPALKARLPKVDIRIVESTSAQLKDRMAEGKIDYALMAFPYDMPGFHQRPLFREDFVCAIPAGADPFGKKDAIRSEDLADQKILLLEDGHCLRSHALAACRLSGTQEQKAFQASSLSTLIQMVAHGQGITLLPRMAVTCGALPAGIAIKPFASPAPARTIGVVWRDKSSREADFEIFTGALTDSLTRLDISLDNIRNIIS